MLENLDATLAELVGKIETLSPKLWGIAMKEVNVNLLAYCIGFGIGIILLTIGVSCLVCLYKKYKREQTEEGCSLDEAASLGLLMIGILASTFGLGMVISFGYEIGTILINPEYRALEIIMELVK